jgi:hydroxymethylpyrimidine/phosphomethylpyrimidine kinase
MSAPIVNNPMPTVLTIAGFDPSSGAGITADLMVFAAHSLFGTCCITGLTVQSTVGVESTQAVSPELVLATLTCLHADLPPVGIKVGMLTTAANVAVVCEYLDGMRRECSNRGLEHVPVVLDPVIRSSSGRELLSPEGVQAMREHLLPLVDWITPNFAELAILAACGPGNDARSASRMLQKSVGRRIDGSMLGIVATGGHADPPDDFQLTPEGEEIWHAGEKVFTQSTHGTGCSYSSAFLARLVYGYEPQMAAIGAKRYVAGALTTAIPRGSGNGPINNLWPLLRAARNGESA